MDTIRILTSYRKAVARDRAAVHVLAFLHRDGPQEEGSLAEKTRTSIFDVRAKLNELYRSSLVVLVDPSHFATSDLAEQVLAQLGISSVVARESLDDAKLPEREASFLHACLRRSENAPFSARRYLYTAVRSAQAMTAPSDVDSDTRTAILYATVAGLDPANHELGCDMYTKYVSSEPGCDAVREDLPAFAFQCKAATDLRNASNHFLASGRSADGLNTEAVLAVTFIRLFTSAVTAIVDDGVAATLNTTGLNEHAIERLTRWSTKREEPIRRLPWGALHRERLRAPSIVPFLIGRIRDSAWSAHGVSGWGEKARRESVGDSSGILQELRAIEQRISRGDLDASDLPAAMSVVELLSDRLARLVSARSGDQPTTKH